MKKRMTRFLCLLLTGAVLLTTDVTAFATENAGDSTAAQSGTTVEDGVSPQSETDGTDANGTDESGTDTNAENTDAGENTDAAVTNTSVEGTVTTNDSQNTEAEKSTETTGNVSGQVVTDVNNDDVEIKETDKPYLALGADLTDAQRSTVLSLMGIDASKLADYNVSYITNQEEHQYLDAYVDASKIGSKSLSSVVIVERKKGSGLNISTSNINYCTVGMYKNALTTAGITDADIIVAGPTSISGTAALVGIFKAYENMTGETVETDVIDAALHELVITGELEQTIEGLTDEEVEEFIAYIKSVIAKNNLKDEASINEAIDEACEKYGVTLSDSERQQIVDLLLKITSLNIDLNALVDYASSLYNSFKNGGSSDGFFSSIGNFFSNVFNTIGDFFKNLFGK